MHARTCRRRTRAAASARADSAASLAILASYSALGSGGASPVKSAKRCLTFGFFSCCVRLGLEDHVAQAALHTMQLLGEAPERAIAFGDRAARAFEPKAYNFTDPCESACACVCSPRHMSYARRRRASRSACTGAHWFA